MNLIYKRLGVTSTQLFVQINLPRMESEPKCHFTETETEKAVWSCFFLISL